MTTTLIQEERASGLAMAEGPDVAAGAATLRLKLRERPTETDRLSRLSEETIADLEKVRLFEITTPRIYGGLQLDLRAYMDAMVELGRGDASVSWVATLVNINNWFISTPVPARGQRAGFRKAGGSGCGGAPAAQLQGAKGQRGLSDRRRRMGVQLRGLSRPVGPAGISGAGGGRRLFRVRAVAQKRCPGTR